MFILQFACFLFSPISLRKFERKNISPYCLFQSRLPMHHFPAILLVLCSVLKICHHVSRKQFFNIRSNLALNLVILKLIIHFAQFALKRIASITVKSFHSSCSLKTKLTSGENIAGKFNNDFQICISSKRKA